MKGFSHPRLTCALVLSTTLASICLAGTASGFAIDTVVGRGVGDRSKAKRAGLLSPTGVAIQGDSTLIADADHARIRSVKPSGKIRTFAGTYPGTFGDLGPANAAGLKIPIKVRVAANGDVLIAEYGSHRIRLISNGTATTIAGIADSPGAGGDGGLATAAHLNAPADAFKDAAGNVYIADSTNHRIRKINGATGVITTIAGTGTPGFSGNNGPATQAQLNNPVCIVPGANGVLYVCDASNNAIRMIDAGGVIHPLAGNGQAGFSGDGGRAKRAKLNAPSDVALAANGDLIVADSGNQRLRLIKLGGKRPKISTIAGNGVRGFTGTGVPALSPLGDPSGVAVRSDGGILIAEASNNRVRILRDGVLANFAGDGVATFGGDGGKASKATFGEIHGVNIDSQGNILVADNGNNRIRRVDAATEIVQTIAGNGAVAFSGDGGPATAAGMSVSDLVVDAQGNILFSDTENDRIRRIDTSGKITTVAGSGTPGFSGDGGAATAAKLDAPTGIALDGSGNLYVADFNNHRIRRIDAATQKISTVAGNGAAGYNGDDKAATTASLNNPTDVGFDASGNMLIADFRNHRIRKVTGGQITTIAGTGTAGDNGDGPLTPTSLQLDSPSDVQVDADGNILIADSGNHKIRRIAAANGGMTTIAGSGLAGLLDAADALQGRMSAPLRMRLLSGGSMLVADSSNYVIRMIAP
jgi:sugar lactone lactonase YvrE